MIGIGVIGCGHWGPNHIRNLSAVAGAKVFLAADLDARRRATVEKLFPDVRVVVDLASHDVSIFNYLRGALPNTVSARGGKFLRSQIDDVAFITLDYPGNVMASIMVSWLHPHKVRQVTVVGDRRMIVWNDLGP